MDERRERRSRLRSWSGGIASWTSRLQRTVTSRGGPVSARLYRSQIMPAEDLEEGDARKLAPPGRPKQPTATQDCSVCSKVRRCNSPVAAILHDNSFCGGNVET